MIPSLFCLDENAGAQLYALVRKALPATRVSTFATIGALNERLAAEPADGIVLRSSSESSAQEAAGEIRRIDDRVRILACLPDRMLTLPPAGIDRVASESITAPAMREHLEHLLGMRTAAPAGAGSGMIGESEAMRRVEQLVRLVASRRSTVLITGETGTGKEVAARAIHQLGSRSRERFVAVNCSAIPETLLESELFGHVRGAFTGAVQQRAGRFEEARNGTIFLDEIGELPLDLQAKLLRVLQEREFQRLGSSESIPMEARVLAATNVDLGARVRSGAFREDLFYRLNVIPISLPALRDRAMDIPALAAYFVAKVCHAEQLRTKSISADALELLLSYSWPGNIRQLENAIEMAVVLSGERTALTSSDFSLPFENPLLSGYSTGIPLQGMDYTQAVNEFETKLLKDALARTAGNKKRAAQLLGLKRTTLTAKVRSLESSSGYTLM